jgi:hypothetical protein
MGRLVTFGVKGNLNGREKNTSLRKYCDSPVLLFSAGVSTLLGAALCTANQHIKTVTLPYTIALTLLDLEKINVVKIILTNSYIFRYRLRHVFFSPPCCITPSCSRNNKDSSVGSSRATSSNRLCDSTLFGSSGEFEIMQLDFD